MSSANLDNQLTTIDDILDTEITAIKAKTDLLIFSNTNHVFADVKSLLGQTTIDDTYRFTGLTP